MLALAQAVALVMMLLLTMPCENEQFCIILDDNGTCDDGYWLEG
jgi:hypothetical protein